MLNPMSRELIDDWVADFVQTDALHDFAAETRDGAAGVLTQFLCTACEPDVHPAEIEESHVRRALLDHVARLKLPEAAARQAPNLCAGLLEWLQDQGRLGGGRSLAAYCRALRPAFEEAHAGKVKPIRRPGSAIGRNDPCPCGSGLKYKKCCLNSG